MITASLKPGKSASDLDGLKDKLKEEFAKYLGGNEVSDVQFVEETDASGEKKVKMLFKVGNDVVSAPDGPAFMSQAAAAITEPVNLSDIIGISFSKKCPKIKSILFMPTVLIFVRKNFLDFAADLETFFINALESEKKRGKNP